MVFVSTSYSYYCKSYIILISTIFFWVTLYDSKFIFFPAWNWKKLFGPIDFRINRKLIKKVWFQFNLIRFRKDFSESKSIGNLYYRKPYYQQFFFLQHFSKFPKKIFIPIFDDNLKNVNLRIFSLFFPCYKAHSQSFLITGSKLREEGGEGSAYP